jgi:hypothetical protein
MNDYDFYFDEVESCECIGTFEDEYVYDVEVDDDTHTFIANDILVHNSLYISYTPIMESVNYEGDGLKFILHVDNIIIKKMFNKYLDEYATPYKVKSLHDFELETISKSALFIEKKNYLNNIVWEDGVHHEDLSYFYPKGIEIVRRSTPEFVRVHVYEIINYIFGNPNNISQRVLKDLLKKLKKDFEWQSYDNIDSIAMQTSCSNYNDKVYDDINTVVVEKGTHYGVKAAAFHNYLLNQNGEYKTKYDMVKSGRIKYYFCKHNKGDNFGYYFGYLRSFHPKEIVEKEGIEIDIDEQFDKTFLSIVNRFMIPLGFPPFTKELGFFSSIFNF